MQYFRPSSCEKGPGLAAAALGIAVVGAAVAQACTTPVYRYATYRWAREPYVIVYMHDADPAAELEQVQQEVRRRNRGKDAWANLELITLDVRKDAELRGLPPNLRKEMQSRERPNYPTFLVISPVWGLVYEGDLTVSDVGELAQPPAAKRTADMLDGKTTCVMVLLTGEKEDANDKARQAVGKVVKAVNSGQVDLSPQGAFAPPQTDEAEDEEADKNPFQFKTVVVDRYDEKDKWFVRQLLSIEPDLHTLDEPMVFPVYGRARALPPYVGRGISYQNLVEVAYWITGPCSCTVKHQNPGVDLLTQHDWEAVADDMAEHFGAEEGNQGSVTELFPEIVVPGDAPR